MYVPSIVTPQRVPEANAKLQGSEAVAQVAGPGLAGLLAQLAGAAAGLVVDALSFLVSAVCLLRIDRREQVPANARTTGLRQESGPECAWSCWIPICACSRCSGR